LKLGFAFMASGFLTTGAAYAVRLIVLRKVSYEAAGLYQSAWGLGGMYIGFILQAMAADFYPRLTAVSKDNEECNRLVNEQAQISLLLAGPGVLATLTFAPLVIALFYSSKFAAAVPLLRWICLGMTLRVVAWPMGFILVAKGRQTLFLCADFVAALVHTGLAWVFVTRFGLLGAGAAFFGLYVWHGLFVYAIVHHVGGFRWSTSNRKTGLLFISLIGVVFGGFYLLPFWAATSLGALAVLFSGFYSIRALAHLVSLARIPKPIRRVLVRIGLAPKDEGQY
jgi:enterobacterial common antigen flippase